MRQRRPQHSLQSRHPPRHEPIRLPPFHLHRRRRYPPPFAVPLPPVNSSEFPCSLNHPVKFNLELWQITSPTVLKFDDTVEDFCARSRRVSIAICFVGNEIES